MIETATENRLKPFKYLTYIFEKFPNIDTKNTVELDALLLWSYLISNKIRLKTKD
ncbi:transposase domain-containing protein [Inediibacterium massiliense]|uniref:transposase domain-containing protein n=1 Tax=Inediibacterium massiliense TaxID=1658111 RepID=UPI000DA62EFE